MLLKPSSLCIICNMQFQDIIALRDSCVRGSLSYWPFTFIYECSTDGFYILLVYYYYYYIMLFIIHNYAIMIWNKHLLVF